MDRLTAEGKNEEAEVYHGPVHRLRILHLSDLHERADREDEPWRRQHVLGDAWSKNLRRLAEDGGVDLVCFTGDTADRGLAEEYNRATEFFQTVLDVLGLGWDRFFAVPGNHDVHRKTHEDSWQRIREKVLRSGDLEVSRWLDGRGGLLDADDRKRLWERFSAYRSWLLDVGRGELAAVPGYQQRLRLPDRPFDIHVIGLNSAWLCGDNHDMGKIRLTDDQVLRLTSDGRGGALGGFRFALVHHPLTELADGAAARRLLAERTDLVLRGHLHAPELGRQLDPDGRDLYELAAGCLYDPAGADHNTNGCTLLEVKLDDSGRPRACDVWLRSWSPAGHWHDDDSRYGNSRGGRLTLSFARSHVTTCSPLPTDHLEQTTTEQLEGALKHLEALLLDAFAKCQGDFDTARTELATWTLKTGRLYSSHHIAQHQKIYENDVERRKQAILQTIRKSFPLFRRLDPERASGAISGWAKNKLRSHISYLEAKSEIKGARGGIPRLNLKSDRAINSMESAIAVLFAEWEYDHGARVESRRKRS